MSRPEGNHSRSARALWRLAMGSGTRGHRARAAMLSAALSVTATVSAAPTAHQNAKEPVSQPATAKPTKHHWYQIGKATWYGGDFNGKKTANGETFNENELTCAHRDLPLGSVVRVTNLQNHKSLLVRVTDRGPWVENAILDLSHAAAEKLGLGGSAKVGIEQVKSKELKAQEIAQLELPAKPSTTARSGR